MVAGCSLVSDNGPSCSIGTFKTRHDIEKTTGSGGTFVTSFWEAAFPAEAMVSALASMAANVDDGVHLWKKKVDSFCVAAQLADLGVGFWTG